MTTDMALDMNLVQLFVDTAHSMRVELVCLIMILVLWAMGRFARTRIGDKGGGKPLRGKNVAATAEKKRVQERQERSGNASAAKGGPQGDEVMNTSRLLRELAMADAKRLCDSEWVVPRIVQLCQCKVQQALEAYRAALAAGLDLKSLKPADCHQLFSSLVTSSVRTAQTTETLELLRDFRSHGLRVDMSIFASVVKLCTSKHFFADCIAIYDAMATEEGFSIEDRSVWSCLLFCAVESRAFQRCGFFFEKLRELGTPSQKDYWNMIRSGSLHGDWQLLVRLLKDMKDCDVQIDSVIYNTILACCVSANQIDLARTLLQEMDEAGDVSDVITYNTLIKGYAKNRDLDNCFTIYEWMNRRGIKPSQVTFGILLDACINENQVDRAAQVFETMTTEGCPMNTVLYTTLIKGFARLGKMDEAMKVFEQMKGEESVPPDLITFSILIKANCDAGRMESALELLAGALHIGLKPDEVVFNNLLAGCAKQANAELAQRLYEDMVASGIQPSNATFSILIRLYSQCKLLDEAVEMLRTEPAKHKVEVEPRLYSQLLQCCIRARQGRRAVEVYESLVEHSSPSVATHGSILGMCVKLNMFDTAADILAIAAARGEKRIGPADAGAVLEGAARKRKTACTDQCAAAMRKLGLPVDPKIVELAA